MDALANDRKRSRGAIGEHGGRSIASAAMASSRDGGDKRADERKLLLDLPHVARRWRAPVGDQRQAEALADVGVPTT
ncbi:MAG: hypothetical protein H6872_04605 [Methylobacteriaceae bacterium]|nr:hypothetical protein [Methylobacteriaceae bacterium]